MAENIGTLRRRRGATKARLTKLTSRIEHIQASDEVNREQIEECIANLDRIRIGYERAQEEIIEALEGEVTVADSTEEAHFEDRYFELKVTLNQLLRNLPTSRGESRSSTNDEAITRVLQQQSEIIQHISRQASASPPSVDDSSAVSRAMERQNELLSRLANIGGVTSHRPGVKLPALSLPTFDGRSEEWKRFADTFRSLIHEKGELQPVQKFQYLVTSLDGDAAKVIESIELTGENYAIAWDLLKKRYDDPRAIKKRHIECLFSMPTVKKESSAAIRGLIDYTMKHLRVLKAMELPTDSWDELIMHMMETKLDPVTLRAWKQEGNNGAVTLDNLVNYLQKRCQTLERLEARAKDGLDVRIKGEIDKKSTRSRNQKSGQDNKITSLAASTNIIKCCLCDGEHFLYHCKKFIAMTVNERNKEVRRLKLCLNCLRNDHYVKSCKMGSCRECSGRHNTLCHLPLKSKEKLKEEIVDPELTVSTCNESSCQVAVHPSPNVPARCRVILATAIVHAIHPNGSSIPCRILLDSASEAHLITNAACNKFGVKRNRTSEIVTGINESENQIHQACDIVLQSSHSRFRINVHCLVVPKITKNLPSIAISREEFQIPSNLRLADCNFDKSGPIDILIGAEHFYGLLEPGKIELGKDRPVLQNTNFGWIVAGPTGSISKSNSIKCIDALTSLHCSVQQCEFLNRNLERFWEIENIPNAKPIMSDTERQCEEFFDRTTTRDETGRFIVRLPIRENAERLGESRDVALKRLRQLERRFKGNQSLHEQYVNFMREYERLGHMSLVENNEQETESTVAYLPHHCVMKESSSTTKLRAVFDASSKTTSGKSLNDILMVGPTLQGSLIEIMLRFRLHKVALTGDIKKMYRQVIVDPQDRDYQRILWRFSLDDPIREYRLNTVTYGEASSSYLAIKCICSLAKLGEQEYPGASRALLDEIYVDDIMTGAEDVKSAADMQSQISQLLNTGGFEAHKWCSNYPEVLSLLPQDERETSLTLSIDNKTTIKTLGLEWNPNEDRFQFTVRTFESGTTKRQMLSAISKFFDPFGLIGPILIRAKLLMQEIWRINCGWDERLPDEFIDKWEMFKDELNAVETLHIPRRVISHDKPFRLYLQGFCDASERAYGACVYIQVEGMQGELSSQILCSRSRVAPIKTITLPRLELCSAVLLTRLIAIVLRALKLPVASVKVWSDSTVALHWICGDVSRWKPFVANRVTEIVETLPASHWGHVSGKENPADVISRGTSAHRLKDLRIWWAGPPWLLTKRPSQSENLPVVHYPSEAHELIVAEERKTKQTYHVVAELQPIVQSILEMFSSLTKIERVIAYCQRFMSNARKKSQDRVTGPLSTFELQGAQRILVRHVQAGHFKNEISDMKSNRKMKPSSKLAALAPFIDEQGLIRVGGRLQQSSWNFERKHPILLPSGDRFTRLLFEREHKRLLHASQQLLLCTIRQRYWPIRGKDLARQACRSCLRCSRIQPREIIQAMGDLPKSRVQPSRNFYTTGVDFAGPLTTLVNKGRGRKTNKSYVALFVCFATKAVHLEATSELSTAAFLATLRRFVSRRGCPRTIWSDNGTNFVGANRELKEMQQFIKSQVEDQGDVLANEGIEWRFLPPNSPHIGGLWEAGVKSCKYHLKRVMGNTLFTFEELTTTLTQIEACLNSRPLCPMSNDPADLEPLTPAHFLVGGPLTSVPEIDHTDVAMNRLNRWQMIQRVLQAFWRRWAAEYLSGLQGRTKWKTPHDNLILNEFIVICESNLPPLKWKLGRVVELHSGKDGLVRVVSVRTANGIIKRAVTKLCRLPINT